MLSEQLVTYVTVILSALTALGAILSAAKSGALKRIKFGSFEIEADEREKQQARVIVETIASPQKRELPFETEQLASYYAQVLAQSKVSFWFSLVFASIGFIVIVLAGMRFVASEVTGAVVQLISGAIIDAVAALFFVQSNKAQTALSAFFEKLRLDRQQLDGKALCESITDETARNAVKVQLSLYFCGIPKFDEISKGIVDACLSRTQK